MIYITIVIVKEMKRKSKEKLKKREKDREVAREKTQAWKDVDSDAGDSGLQDYGGFPGRDLKKNLGGCG